MPIRRDAGGYARDRGSVSLALVGANLQIRVISRLFLNKNCPVNLYRVLLCSSLVDSAGLAASFTLY